MHLAPAHRATGGRQRLAEHLAAKNLGSADVAALPAEDVFLQRLEFQQVDEVGQRLIHVPFRRLAGGSLYTGRRLRQAPRLC